MAKFAAEEPNQHVIQNLLAENINASCEIIFFVYMYHQCSQNGVMYRGKTTAPRPFTRVQNEGSRWKSHLCRVSWKFGYKKRLLQKSDLKVMCMCSSPKIPYSDCGWNISGAWAQEHSSIFCESIIHQSGPIPRPRRVKDEYRQSVPFCRTALWTPFQHSTNVYNCK